MILKQIRQSRNKTQLDVAKAIGITQFTYSNYENEKTEPPLSILKKIADYFDVSLDFLLQRPHPHDLPMVATEQQRNIVNLVLQLDGRNCDKVEYFIAGLLAGEQDHRETIKKLGGK